jgi:hypothetical protein
LAFVSNLVNVAQSGGTLNVRAVFERNDLITTLARDLKALGFNVTEADIRINYASIETCLGDILAGTSILLGHPNVKSCNFEERVVGNRARLMFIIYTKGLASATIMKLPDNIGIACDVFTSP